MSAEKKAPGVPGLLMHNKEKPSSLLKNPRQNESSLIQFFYHESVETRMRGAFTDQGQLFSYISPEARVRTDHPLRTIRELVRDVLGELNSVSNGECRRRPRYGDCRRNGSNQPRARSSATN
jgi:hypothetical protein